MKKIIFKILFLLISTSVFAQLEDTARTKMLELSGYITQAEDKGLDVTKEKMSIRVAEVFLKYANWDENNVAVNTEYFELVARYKDNAAQFANDLPDFERNEIIIMLNDAIATIQKVISGEIVRKETPIIDWSKITIEGNAVKHNGKPVFLTDYTWKPYIPELNEYFGAKDGFFLAPTHVNNASGGVKSWILNDLNTKTTGTFGSVFLNHSNVSDWAETKYGPGFKMREDTYTAYDVDNPGAREMWGYLLSETLPKMTGKKYTQLGYMLTNEPHFITAKEGTKKVWATGPVSEYTKEKFRVWLEEKHGAIANLNTLWGTSFTDFSGVTIEVPIERGLQGTPKWYDWQRFNMDRITDWFGFLQSEVKKYDPVAKTHIKLIPKFWSNNAGDHGLDMEALTRQSDIIGNDAGAHNNYMWGGKEEWEDRYNFEWREMAMSYDFYTSVSPNKMMYNSETHFLSTVKSRDLYQKPSYARMVYWLSHLHGLDVDQCWFWARREDGSIRNGAGNGYGGSNNQQPRVVNEVTATMMDINSYAEEIHQIQNLRKSIRIFDTQTTAINKAGHMDEIFHLYESLFFEGLQLGFATKDIILNEDNTDWDVILVYDTEFVTLEELEALQAYLDQGGTVITDAISLKKDQYGRNHTTVLNSGTGSLFQLSTQEAITNKALEVAAFQNRFPNVSVTESNGIGVKGCHWRAITTADNREIVSIVNIGKTRATITVELNGLTGSVACVNLLDGKTLGSTLEMEPEQVLFLEVKSLGDVQTDYTLKSIGESCPDANNGALEITAEKTGAYKVTLNGEVTTFTKATSLTNIAPGSYSVCIENVDLGKEQCYEFTIAESENIVATTSKKETTLFVNFEEGTAPYHVRVNDKEVLSTLEKQFSLQTNPGDVIELTTSKECEGTIVEQLSSLSVAYPNPTSGVFYVHVGDESNEVLVELFDMKSQLVKKVRTKQEASRVHVDISDVTAGVYLAKIKGSKSVMVKVIKR
ncbi:T9SS type A sorting domain-containing protein [Wenyingzhuangia sp. IMCC45574]